MRTRSLAAPGLVLALLSTLAVAAEPAKPAPAAPVAAPAPFDWDVPGLESDVPLAGELVAQGVPMRMHAVVSRLDALELYRHFGREFIKAGFYLPPRRDLPANLPLHLSAVDPKRLLVYTVFFKSRADKKTTLYLATSDMKRLRPRDAGFAPTFPGATGLLTSDVEVARTMTYEASATPEQVRAFYQEALGKAGYREVQANLFERDGEQLSVHATASKDKNKNGKVGVVVMSRSHPAEGLAGRAAAP